MPQLSRRQVVVLGGVGIAAITTGVAGLVGQQRAGTGASRTKWKEPPRMASVDGRLDVELTAGQHQAQLAGRDVSVLAYNGLDRKSTRLNSSHVAISYAVFCLKKKKKKTNA